MEMLKFGNFSLAPVEYIPEHIAFFKKLFSIGDVKEYYVIPLEYDDDIEGFVLNIANSRSGLDYIIYTNDNQPIGIISAEINEFPNGEPFWNVGYALLNDFRHKGYATMALSGLGNILSNFTINTMCLDINMNNTASQAVAKRCGYEVEKSSTGGLVGFLDKERPGKGLRCRWSKSVRNIGDREKLCLKALEAYKQRKDYLETLRLYKEALKFEPSVGSTWTNGQIYSNIGITLSATEHYAQAYEYLMKAWNEGIQNPSVARELKWLTDHRHLW